MNPTEQFEWNRVDRWTLALGLCKRIKVSLKKVFYTLRNFPRWYPTCFTSLLSTIMVPDVALELSLDQLISALDKKLFMEFTRVQAAMPPMSHALVAKLATEV